MSVFVPKVTNYVQNMSASVVYTGHSTLPQKRNASYNRHPCWAQPNSLQAIPDLVNNQQRLYCEDDALLEVKLKQLLSVVGFQVLLVSFTGGPSSINVVADIVSDGLQEVVVLVAFLVHGS